MNRSLHAAQDDHLRLSKCMLLLVFFSVWPALIMFTYFLYHTKYTFVISISLMQVVVVVVSILAFLEGSFI